MRHTQTSSPMPTSASPEGRCDSSRQTDRQTHTVRAASEIVTNLCAQNSPPPTMNIAEVMCCSHLPGLSV